MYIRPMLPQKSKEPLHSTVHIFEPKIDGHRLILSRKGIETRFWSGSRMECTRQYPELWDVPVAGDVILDGAVCLIDPLTGAARSDLVKERLRTKKRAAIRAAAARRPVHYVVFDILYHDGKDLRQLPLLKRKSILHAVLTPNNRFNPIPQVDDNGEDLYRLIGDRKLSGIIAKRKDSVYVSKRSHDWLHIARSEK